MSVVLEDMIQSIELWLKLIKKPQSYVNPNLDPVLLVPGVAGSILKAVDEKGNEERVWVRILSADHEFRNKLWSRFDSSTGLTVSLDEKTRIVVPEDRYGLHAIDTLDPDLIIGRDCVGYFHDMIVEMRQWGFQEGKTLFGFGYDFRQSNRLQETMDRFAAKLELVYTASGGKKINIISHSMGGLLVKCFMCLKSDIFEKYVKNWIAIAAPFRDHMVKQPSCPTRHDKSPDVDVGSTKLLRLFVEIEFKIHPKALLMPNSHHMTLSCLVGQGAPGYITAGLLNGMSFVEGWEQNLFISKWSMQQLLIECPSIYELMACPNFDWKMTPLLEIWREKHNGNGRSIMLESYEPAEMIPIFKEALSANTVNYCGTDMTLPFNLEILKWANETQKLMSCAKVPSQVKFYNIYGLGYDTPHSVCYGSENAPITELPQVLSLQPKYICVDGDGTVPVESAKADGLYAEARVGVPGNHRGIICDHHVFRILKHWLKAGDLDPFYNPLNDYVILPTAFDIEKSEEEGLLITSLQEEWEIISREDKDGHYTETVKKPVVTSISVSHVGKDQSSSRAEAHATAIIVPPQREDKKYIEFRAAVSVSVGE